MAALVPLILGVVLPEQVRTIVCRFSGAVMDVRCCPGEPREPAGRVAADGQLRGESCCAVRTIDLARLVSDRLAESVPPRHQALRGEMAVVAERLPFTGLSHVRHVRPPFVRTSFGGPPLVLLKRSFLI